MPPAQTHVSHLSGIWCNCEASPVVCSLYSGLSCPLPHLLLFLASQVLILLLPRHGNHQDPAALWCQKSWACHTAAALPRAVLRGVSQINPPFGVRGRRFDGNSGSRALLTNMFLLPLLLLSASDGPDSGNWEQLPFFSELTEQQLSAWGCMDVRGGQAQVPPGEVKSVWQQLCCSSAGKGQCGTGKLSPWHGSLLELHICDLRGVFMCMHVRPSPLLACQ